MDENTGKQLPAPGLPSPGLSTAGLFDHYLTDEDLARLWSMLDSGRYEVLAPEEAALLCVAWLVRAGESGAAATAKGTACAWRQLLFHLALCDADEQARVLTWIDARAARLPARTAARIALPLTDLRLAVAVP
ncbi:hypothetical protein ACFW9N_25650 [Streptomyces sp. NPDC059496]|uniref:hypothetical protein n=1 Tax=Streptomyces sp. NPDC059496 TaxID=3346851 RepID=UPI0036A9B6E1